MTIDYPLEQLSPRAFEQLTVALSLQVIGSGIEAFGAGADGGREAAYNGKINWSATDYFGTESWDGYVVVQAKQRQENDALPSRNAGWLRTQIKEELDCWEDIESRRGRFPQYIIFVTNVRLSSTAESGGIDSLNRYISERHQESLEKRGLRGWKIWHRDQLNGLLTQHSGIRHAFPSMLTAGDVFSRLNELSDRLSPDQLHGFLLAHANSALQGERWINFSESGGNSRQSVDRVIIDLPAETESNDKGFALRTVLKQGESSLRASLVSTPRHIVLTGAPGNGKSTLSRFLTQMYRTSFLAEEDNMGLTADIVSGTEDALRRLSIKAPKNRRWPVRVDLAELADDLGPSSDKSLLRWLSEKVSQRADIDIHPHQLQTWLRVWPWFIVFDGLDEVTSPEVRRRILDELESFVDKADRLDADVFIVVTTRPTGYSERISPHHFTQIDLGYLEPYKALEYGKLVTNIRLHDDPEQRDRTLSRFKKAAYNPTTERLLKTPLQVLILTFILERLGTLPADRYQLFWRYYETVYDREASKATSLASLFTNHRSDITEIHEAVGLKLQIHAELTGDAKARMPLSELRELAVNRMVEVGHDPEREAPRIAEQILQAATQRLVLLVATENDTISFEVRSLQELMAARSLSSATDEIVKERLHATAPSPHWRNTWVFVAGRIFSDGPDSRRDLVTNIVESFDQSDSWPGWLCPVGPELAADLLDDGLAVTKPKWLRRFVDVSLRSLNGTIPRDMRGLATGLSTASSVGNNLTYVRNVLKEGLAGSPKSQAIACMIFHKGEFGAHIPGMLSMAKEHMRMWDGEASPDEGEPINVGELLRRSLEELGTIGPADDVVGHALQELETLQLKRTKVSLWPELPDPSRTWPMTLGALEDPEANSALELLCGNLRAEDWQAKAILARALWPSLARRPAGEILRELS